MEGQIPRQFEISDLKFQKILAGDASEMEGKEPRQFEFEI
jgi:hypothetical protein